MALEPSNSMPTSSADDICIPCKCQAPLDANGESIGLPASKGKISPAKQSKKTAKTSPPKKKKNTAPPKNTASVKKGLVTQLIMQ